MDLHTYISRLARSIYRLHFFRTYERPSMFEKKRFCLSRILGSCALNLNSTKITLRSSVNLLKHLVRYLCLFNYTKWLQMKPTCYNEERIANPKKVQGTIKQGHLFLTRFQIANAIHRFYTTSEGIVQSPFEFMFDPKET